MQLDPVDQKHIYVPFEKKILRLPVSQCRKYQTLQECWSAQDPFCVWCGSKNRCTFEVDCDTSNWLSISGKQKKMVTHKVVMETPEKIKLVVQIHATGGENVKSSFACRFSQPLDKIKSLSRFPQCIFNLLVTFPLLKNNSISKTALGSKKTEFCLRVSIVSELGVYGQTTAVLGPVMETRLTVFAKKTHQTSFLGL
ncbi:hypothetical protein OJAV_G00219740 [Oryzias javanicus]|uniref:Sema domain-containing protein n=1 Tax=Oryzias javanicus TaxID=123683 RepID=A0A437C0S4_ORYJA|nr:hypothetical protein OJAV_G00219740 [Oryzias javanicus]